MNPFKIVYTSLLLHHTVGRHINFYHTMLETCSSGAKDGYIIDRSPQAREKMHAMNMSELESECTYWALCFQARPKSWKFIIFIRCWLQRWHHVCLWILTFSVLKSWICIFVYTIHTRMCYSAYLILHTLDYNQQQGLAEFQALSWMLDDNFIIQW